MVRHEESKLQADNRQLRERVAELEQELSQTRLRLEEIDQLYHTAPIGLCLMDRELRFVRINAQLAAINGLPVKDHIGATIREILPALADTLEPLQQQVLDTGEPILDLEIAGSTAAHPNDVCHYLVSYFPVKNDRDEVIGVNTVVQDITEAKESEARLRTLVEHAPEAIVLFDADTGKFVDANRNAERLFGLDREALLKVGPLEMSPVTQPDGHASKAFGKAQIAHALAGGAPVFEWSHTNAEGKEIPCEIRLVRLPYTGRNLLRGSITDISDRIAAQKALQAAHDELEQRVAERTAELAESEERWRSLIQTAPDLILILDPDGTIRYINQTRQGFDLDEIAGHTAFDYVRPEHFDEIRCCYADVMQTGQIREYESSVEGADGSVRWYSSRVGPFYENGKITGITSIATDVTHRKEAEDKLKAEEQVLRQLLELRETERRMLAYNIHDGFVQDVVGAQMRVEGMCYMDDLDQIKSSLADVSHILQKGISDGRRMIRELRPMVLDEAGVVEAIQHLVADEKEIEEFAVEFTHDVEFDRLESKLEGAIFRIVQEALNNVKQHAQTTTAQVNLTQHDGKLLIEVRDKGRGFDLNKVSAARFGIRGMYERARVFGGQTTIETKPGKGTTIRVELPIVPAAEKLTTN